MPSRNYYDTFEKLKKKGVPIAEASQMAQAMDRPREHPGGLGAGVRMEKQAERDDLTREAKQTLSMGGGGGGLKTLLPLIVGAMAMGGMKGGEQETAPTDYTGMITETANKYGVPPALALSVARAESNFNPSAKSPAGAQGLMQLMPKTAEGLGVTNPLDPQQNVDGGVRYLDQMLDMFGGDQKLALAGYNAGPGNVRKHGGVPPFKETQDYIPRVMGFMEEYQQQPAMKGTDTPVRPMEKVDLTQLASLFPKESTSNALPPMLSKNNFSASERTTPPLIPTDAPSVDYALGQAAAKSAGSTAGNVGSAALSGGMMAGPWGAAAMGGTALVSGLLDDSGEEEEEARKNAERMQKQERLLGSISGIRDWAGSSNARLRAQLMQLGGLG